MKLPKEFEERMKRLLGPDYGPFLESYDRERSQSLRINTLKIPAEEFLKRSPFTLRPVPWSAGEGCYYESGERPGKYPYHDAGLYYIQEPSAMAVGVLADPQPGERVLDLCAAPGGKTTQLAAAMKGQGLLVSNEIHPARAKILSQNVERMGIANAVVTNENPKDLEERFSGFFDRIVVDAPCSGEGMFLKEDQACGQWSEQNVQMCARRQKEILNSAARMLRAGGTLVYSTCTFAPEENEGAVSVFLEAHPDFSVKQTEAYEGFSEGRPDWVDGNGLEETRNTFRLWPHLLEGEGHYAAVLQKEGGREPEEQPQRRGKNAAAGAGKSAGKQSQLERRAYALFEDFAKENLLRLPDGVPVLFGEQLYLLPCEMELKGLKVVRAGLHLGTCRKDRFEPSHALALHLKAEEAAQRCELCSDDERVLAYLKGEAIPFEGGKGWNLVTVDGYSLGWGKLSEGLLKNHYPKGLRWV